MALPDKMIAVEIVKPGGPEVLSRTLRPTPSPGPDELLIEVHAAGVNRPDVLQRLGLYPPPPGASDIPGLEVAGTVAAVGPGSNQFRIGERVCALLAGGGYAEFACANAHVCLPVPEGMSIIEAAALPEAIFTVWANVFEDGALQPGERLLVHGGASGIGTTAVMLAKARGSWVAATASTPEKCCEIERIGADLALNYRDEDWSRRLIDIGGVDVVLDMAGGDFLERNLETLRTGGRHVSIAFLRGVRGSVDIMAIMRKRLTLRGSTMKSRSAAEKARLAAEIRREVWPFVEVGKLRPVIDQVFPLLNAGDAHRRMESGSHFGKIVLGVRPT